MRCLQGVLGQALPQLRQLFEHISAPSAAGDADVRFAHFTAHVWPQIKESSANGEMQESLWLLPMLSTLLLQMHLCQSL